jgi:hypothetical protein
VKLAQFLISLFRYLDFDLFRYKTKKTLGQVVHDSFFILRSQQALLYAYEYNEGQNSVYSCFIFHHGGSGGKKHHQNSGFFGLN